MLVGWMIYAMSFTALAAGGALAFDRVVAIWGGARRFVWLGALLLSAIVPVALAFRPWTRLPASAAINGPTGALDVTRSADRAPVASSLANAGWHMPASWNRYAAGAWTGTSTILLVMLLHGFLVIRRRGAAWHRAEVDGHTILLAADVGPAVVGALHPRIVLPAWVLELGRSERELMLRHEAEHIRAGDPRILLLAALSIVVFPWNAALWLVVQRLRLAIEIDCDARVLRAVGRPREYGLLLLAVGARHGVSLPLAASLAASLAERRPLLERRIVAMTTLRPSRPVLASIPFAALVLIAAAGVAQTPAPAPLRAAQRAAPTHVAPARPSRADSITVAMIRAWIARYHPALAQGDTTDNLVGFAIDSAGNVLATDTGYDPDLNDRLATIRSVREALRRGDRSTAGEIVAGRVDSTVRTPNTAMRQKTNMFSKLHLRGDEIAWVEGRNTFPGEIVPGALEVMVIRIKP